MTSGATASAARRGRERRASGARLWPGGREEANMRASLVSQGDDVRARARGWAAGLLGYVAVGPRDWFGFLFLVSFSSFLFSKSTPTN